MKKLLMSGVFAVLLMRVLTGCSTADESTAVAEAPPVVQEQPAAENPELTPCPEQRPKICTMDYRPVCGVSEDGSRRTYGNFCGACGDEKVVGVVPGIGSCPE